jgi:trehalose/maltose transport system substrate-binding protein
MLIRIIHRHLKKGIASLFLFCLSTSQLAAGKPVVITCGMVGQEFQSCQEGVARWEKKTGKKAKIIEAPNGSNERLTIFQQHLAARSPDIDVYQVDVVWPGLLGPHFLDLKPYLTPERQAAYIPALFKSTTVDGKVVSLPWFLQTSVFYYRKDLLEKYKLPVPQTWDDVEKASKIIMDGEKAAGNNQLWGFIFQGKAYEGLTCNALDWISSYKGGGTIVDDQGNVTINNPSAITAIDKVAKWIGTISPTGVLNYDQEGCRGVFQDGKSIFMRNWTYAWNLMNEKGSPVAGKVGITSMPKGGADGQSTGTIGGWNLAVSKYSQNQKDAIDLALYLTSEEELRHRALGHGHYPTMLKLYKEPKVLAISPIIKIMLEMLQNASMRPAGQTADKYSQVSSIFWNAVHTTLSGKQPAAKSLADAEKKLNLLRRNGKSWSRIK